MIIGGECHVSPQRLRTEIRDRQPREIHLDDGGSRFVTPHN